MNTRSYKIALICNILGLLAIIGYVAFNLFFNENINYDIIPLLFCALPIVVMVLDYIALTKHKWLGWSIASISIKTIFLLFYLMQAFYAVGSLLEYGYRYYYIAPIIAILFLALTLYPSIYSIKNVDKNIAREKSGKPTKHPDCISIVVFSIGLAIAGLFLILGLNSIGASGWGKLGLAFIPPSLLVIVILLLDFFAIKDCKWFAWSVVSLVIKSLCAITIIPYAWESFYLLPLAFFEITYFLIFLFFAALLVFIAISTYPSIRNIVNISKRKRENANEQ